VAVDPTQPGRPPESPGSPASLIPGGRPPGSRRSRLLQFGPEGLRSLVIAAISTVVVFGALGYVIVNSSGWPAVQEAFFNREVFEESWPRQVEAVVTNIELFIIAELLILPLGLLIAILRSLPGPVFFPLRLMAVVYTDLFRGIPGLLVIYLLGFGIPALDLPGVPNDPFFWGVVSLTLVYSAYVAEVYRAGIQSVHPSQAAAARSLGLGHFQALRFVVVPQAIRRVVPPLLNDFIGLQKDTALVSTIGVVEVFRQAQIDQSATFNFTPYLATAIIFLILTIPLARLTDVLVERDRKRRLAAGAFR
jgi:polar amino acid transport system permease protein